MSAQSACRRISGLLSSYLDGDLIVSARWDVKLHLASCPSCARLAAELAATVNALHQLRHFALVASAPSVTAADGKPDRPFEASSGKALPN
jgi:anti-sigma factor RsiW